MEYVKPIWKERAENEGSSLPGYWNMREIEKELCIGNGYAARLAKKYGLQTWKIGQVRLMKDKDFQWLANNFKKR